MLHDAHVRQGEPPNGGWECTDVEAARAVMGAWLWQAAVPKILAPYSINPLPDKKPQQITGRKIFPPLGAHGRD